MLKALFALVAAAMFSGGALTALLGSMRSVGHDARSGGAARGLQMLLGFVSLLLGAWAWVKMGDQALLVGALLIGVAVPLTYLGQARFAALKALLGLAAVAAFVVAFLWP